MRPLLIGFFVCINIHLGYAQWTEQDSIWLKDVLAGKDSIKLNPEFQKAIQSGSFLNPEPGKPMGKPQLAAPSNIPITKDFSEYIQQDDTTHRKVALKDLPPSEKDSIQWSYLTSYLRSRKNDQPENICP